MSSTNRSKLSKEEREKKKDYYVTPVNKILEFIDEIVVYEEDIFEGVILDPTSGGDLNHLMSYPEALKRCGYTNVKTIDIREDSLAELKADYLTYKLPYKPHTIITNPPFNIAEQIIKKSLNDVEIGGYVVMLLRLNFFGGKARMKFWNEVGLPKYAFVHHRRLSFTDDGNTDSIEYAHFVWQKGYESDFTMLKVI